MGESRVSAFFSVWLAEMIFLDKTSTLLCVAAHGSVCTCYLFVKYVFVCLFVCSCACRRAEGGKEGGDGGVHKEGVTFKKKKN